MPADGRRAPFVTPEVLPVTCCSLRSDEYMNHWLDSHKSQWIKTTRNHFVDQTSRACRCLPENSGRMNE